MRVTFDSNVWQMVVVPELARKSGLYDTFAVVHEALKAQRIRGYLCETVGTLEAIKLDGREAYFKNLKPIVDVKVDVSGDQALLTINVDSNHGQHPGLHRVVIDRLGLAHSLGIRLMRAARMGIPVPASFLDLSRFADEDDVPTSAARDNRWGEIVEAIEQRGVGAAAMTIPRTETHGARPTAEREFAQAIAEWADGDSMAAHIAFGNDVFCTQDQGRSSGRRSILDPENREWLAATYSVRFATIHELAAEIQNMSQS